MPKSKPIKIGICAHCFASYKSGIGRYAWELFLVLYKSLPNATFYLYSNRKIELPTELDRAIIRSPKNKLENRMPVYFWLKFLSPFYIKTDKPDFIWSPITLSPLFYRSKTIVTVHDLNHLLVKETMPLVNAIFFKIWFKVDVAGALKRICNSQGTASRLKQHYGIDTDAIIRPAVSDDFIRKKFDITSSTHLITQKKYILAVSTIEPRKNLLSLVKAYTELQKEGKALDVDLVLVGKKGWKNTEFDNFVAQAPNNTIHFTGFVDDNTLIDYYKQATVFAMPSIYEGFGMPVAEALAFGTPALCSEIPELRESGQNLCTYIEPTSDGIKQGLIHMLNNNDNSQLQKFKPITWLDEGIKMARLFNK